MISANRKLKSSIKIVTIVLPLLLLTMTPARAQVFRATGDVGVGFRGDVRMPNSEYTYQYGYENFMSLGLSSWLLDPRFVTYNAWGRVFWREVYADSSIDGPTTPGYGSLFNNNQQFLSLDYKLRLGFFQRRPYNFQLYANRSSQAFDFQSLPPYEIVHETYGAAFLIGLAGFTVKSTGEFRRAQYIDFYNQFDYQDIAVDSSVYRATPTQKFKVIHRYLDRQELGGGTDFIDNNLYLYDDITPSKTTKLYLQGGLRRYESDTSGIVTDTYTFAPAFQWRPDEWTIYDLRADFHYSEVTDNSITSSSRVGANINKQVKRGLWLKGGLGSSYTQMDALTNGVDTDTYNGTANLGFNYTRLIRYYRATMAAETAWGYTDSNPGDDGLVHNHMANAVVYDPHLKTVIWYGELRAAYTADETDDGIDSVVYYAKFNVKSKNPTKLVYWVEAGYTDVYFYYRSNDVNTRSVNTTAQFTYKIDDMQMLRWGAGNTYFFEPTVRNMATATLGYDVYYRKKLTGKLAAQYFYTDPSDSEARNLAAAQAEVIYKLRSVTLSGKYQLLFKEFENSDRYQEHIVYIQAKRDFSGTWIRRPKPKMMKMMQMTR